MDLNTPRPRGGDWGLSPISCTADKWGQSPIFHAAAIWGQSPNLRRARVAAASLALALAACGDSSSPDAQVRATIAAMETAAEARDVGDLTEHISTEFRDAHGRDTKELSQYVRGYFIANQSIHLLTRIESIEFPTHDEARAKVSVAMVGREAESAKQWNLAGDLYDFDVTFMREDGEWKVRYAKWQ